MAGQKKSKRIRGKYDHAFAARLNQYRELRGLREEELGLGIHQSMSAGVRICRAEQTVYLDQIIELAAVLQVSPGTLVDFAVNPLALPATSPALAVVDHCAAQLCAIVDTLKRLSV
jgi:transcriptional regulator with XRE-family HTH domain